MPSSPNGPCSTGKATSAPSRPPPGRSASGSPSGPVQLPSRSSRRAATSWPAAATPGDARWRAGHARDLVLGGAPAAQDGHPHGAVRLRCRASGVGVGSAPRGGRPSMTTREPGGTSSPGAGSWATTMPSWAGIGDRLVAHGDRRSRRPPAPRCASASGTGLVVTSGTSTSGGAVATTIATVLPGATFVPAAGSCSSTTPCSASVVSRSVDVRHEPDGVERPLGGGLRGARRRRAPSPAPRRARRRASPPCPARPPSPRAATVSITRPLRDVVGVTRARAATSKPASRSGRLGLRRRGSPATPGTGASPGPAGHGDGHRRALVGLLARRPGPA